VFLFSVFIALSSTLRNTPKQPKGLMIAWTGTATNP